MTTTKPVQTPTTGTVQTGTGTIQTGSTNPISSGNQSPSNVSGTYTINLSDAEPALMLVLQSGDIITLQVEQPLSNKTVLRLNQIISPDGTADGPFDRTTTYTATQSGKYTFRIGANLMASEEPYTGSIAVHVMTVVK